MIEYANVSIGIARVISRGLATLHELDTVYGAEDLYNLIEIIAVDNYNSRVAAQKD